MRSAGSRIKASRAASRRRDLYVRDDATGKWQPRKTVGDGKRTFRLIWTGTQLIAWGGTRETVGTVAQRRVGLARDVRYVRARHRAREHRRDHPPHVVIVA
jgi:hypothetical protein